MGAWAADFGSSVRQHERSGVCDEGVTVQGSSKAGSTVAAAQVRLFARVLLILG